MVVHRLIRPSPPNPRVYRVGGSLLFCAQQNRVMALAAAEMTTFSGSSAVPTAQPSSCPSPPAPHPAHTTGTDVSLPRASILNKTSLRATGRLLSLNERQR